MAIPLIAAAHGTRSAAGLATIRRLVDLVHAERPELHIELCFLDVLFPRLDECVASLSGPAVVVPVLLSGGYHVFDDIPSVTAAHSTVTVAAHLGPHRLITDALIDRLDSAGGLAADRIVLIGAPSRRTEAHNDVAAAAADLALRLDRPVVTAPLDDALAGTLSGARGRIALASYLLAEGAFHDAICAAAVRTPVIAVSAPLGAHPAIAELIIERYDEAASRTG